MRQKLFQTDLHSAAWLVVAAFLLGAVPARASDDEAGAEFVHEVSSQGATIGSLALQYSVPVSKLKEWNNMNRPGPLERGTRIRIKRTRVKSDQQTDPVIHQVEPGQTLLSIAHNYGVSLRQLKDWNPRVSAASLQIGEHIRLHVPDEDGRSVSWGRPNEGRLFNGVALEDTIGLKVRNTHRAYGTRRVIHLLEAAAADIQGRWPDAPKLIVGDLSYESGGEMPPHKSHESGRDADLSFYHKGNAQLERFRAMNPETLDVVKTWRFFRQLIEAGVVEYIFVAYDLQKPLYEYARTLGYTERELKQIFQYPRSRHRRVGLIRDVGGGHDDHFHIRFTCPEYARHCH